MRNPMALFVALACLVSGPARAQTTGSPPPQASSGDAQDLKERAKERFQRGIELFDARSWDPALVEFLQSRELHPTRSNTKNAALCLRNLNRYDEALELFETLLREFPTTPEEQAKVSEEVESLKRLVGLVELRTEVSGARITVDGREQGITPMSSPFRVNAGSRTVRVYKAGYLPFERRVDVAGGRQVTLSVTLDPLAESGRMVVNEERGAAAEVVVDNLVVGTTPWQGLLPPGEHTVYLRAAANRGTQPALAIVRLNRTTAMTLALERLDAGVRVEPTPTIARIAIDGVTIGSGVWEGRLRSGRHLLEVGAEGFLPMRKEIVVGAGEFERFASRLERDPESPLWGQRRRARVFFELDAGGGLFPSAGGELASSCGGDCEATLHAGGRAVLHAGYEFGSGIGLAIDVGGLWTTQSFDKRDALLTPVGRPPNSGLATDELSIRGLTFGVSGSFRRGDTWPLTFRLGAGAWLGTAVDRRSGRFLAISGDQTSAYDVGKLSVDPALHAAYVAPEVRVGRLVGSKMELSVGLEGLLGVALAVPRWPSDLQLLTPAQGLAVYEGQAITANALVGLNLSLGLRYEL